MKKLITFSAAILLLAATSCSNVSEISESSVLSNTENTDVVSSDNSSRQNENHEDIVLTLALGGGDNSRIQKVIDEFNSSDNGYQIVTKSFGSSVDDDGFPIETASGDINSADLELIQDIINKDEIDIISTQSFENESKYEILKNKGAFADLYTFMENDSEVNTSTLDQHILSIKETNGKLYSLPTFYQANTLIGETRYVGNKENWTIDDFISHWEQMPEGSTISGSLNSENIYYVVLRSNLESFVDYGNATVNFDSPEFKRILEFCGTFQSNNGQKTDLNYDVPNFVSDYELSGIMSSLVFSPNSQILSREGTDYTLVGFPSSDGYGAFFTDSGGCWSISAKSSSEKQQGAWEFIRTFVTEDYQTENVIEQYRNGGVVSYSSEVGLCVNNNAFDSIAKSIMNGEYYDGTYTDKDVEYTYSLPTQADVDDLRAYLNSINKWETRLDLSLWEIINDEVMAYFSGEKSLEDTVDTIQNRASIWVSEQS